MELPIFLTILSEKIQRDTKLNKRSYSFTNDDNLRCHLKTTLFLMDFPGGSDSKESACSEGDLGLIPGSGRSP